MKSLRWLLAGFLLLALTTTVLAQNAPASGGVIGSYLTPPGAARGSVKGLPFSADVVNEFTQVLGDGTRIHRESPGKTFRDSEGRTRNERVNEMLGQTGTRTTVTIEDPVAGTIVFLFPETKTAIVNHRQTTRLAGPTGTEVKSGSTESVLLETLQTMQAGSASKPAQVGSEARKPQPADTEQLGKKDIEGFTASGTRHTRIIAADTVGNDRPMTTVMETWVADDLRTVLVDITDSPQSGLRIMRLSNIRLGDPDPQLFQIPPDYSVKDNSPKEKL
jgi:hypothetical protein